MTPSHPHFFANWPFRPRFIFAEAPQLQAWVVSATEISEETPLFQIPLKQNLEDVSNSVTQNAVLKVIQQNPGLVEKAPQPDFEQAYEQAVESVREYTKTILGVIVQNAGQVNEQQKQLVLLSVDAKAQFEFDRLRLKMENVLLRKENQDLQVANEELAKKAEIDFLTGLPNRGALEKRLQEEVVRADRAGPLCLLMFDLDKFKEVNDAYGHPKGDEVLKALSHRFRHGEIRQKIMRDADFVGRYGGDEMVFLLPNTDREGAIIAAHRIVKALERDPVFIDDGHGILVKADIGASIGIGIFEGKQKDPTGKNMFADADRCLLTLKGERPDGRGVKEQRRGQIAVDGEVYGHGEVEQMIRESEAKKAADANNG